MICYIIDHTYFVFTFHKVIIDPPRVVGKLRLERLSVVKSNIETLRVSKYKNNGSWPMPMFLCQILLKARVSTSQKTIYLNKVFDNL